MYLAETIDAVLESNKSKLIGCKFYSHICKELNESFNNDKSFVFKFETYQDYGPEDYSVSGLYDMEEDKKYIVLNFCKSKRKFLISPKKWKEFKFAVSQVCQHETIHQCQWSSRDSSEWKTGKPDFRNVEGSIEEDQEYLSDPDEIEAYAHDIAMEIKYFYPKKDPLKVLKNISRHKKLWSFNYYKKTFEGEDWSIIKKRLLKKTYRWLPSVVV